jgi:hypothetical protein
MDVQAKTKLVRIAGGEEFDLVAAIRLLASAVVGLVDEVDEPGGNELAERLNSRLAGMLTAAGFADVESVRAATDEQLLAIDGIGQKGLELIRGRL